MFEDESQTIDSIIQHKISKNVRNLDAFLSQHVREKGDKAANINGPGKIYLIDHAAQATVDEFFSLLEACRVENRIMHYGERQCYGTEEATQYSGCMFDFDRYQTNKNVQVTDKHLTRLVDGISLAILNTLDWGQQKVISFHVFCIRRPEITLVERGGRGVYKDGWHILIPEIQLQKGVKRFIINALEARMDKIFSTCEAALEPMLDKNSASVPVMFYGSSKISKQPKPAYPLTQCWAVTLQPDEEPREQIIVESVPLSSIPAGVNMVYELSLGFYVAQLCGRATWLRKARYEHRLQYEDTIQGLVDRRKGLVFDEDELLETQRGIDMLALNNAEANYLRKLLELLDISYATEYKKWFEVICAIAHTSETFKPLAEWFSRRRPDNYSADEFERVWSEALSGRAHGTPLTKRSLLYWARESSPERFRELQSLNYIQTLMEMAIKNDGRIEHAMVAALLKTMISDKFVCDIGVDKTYQWYEFVTPGQSMRKGEVYKWRFEPRPDNIHIYIGEHMPKVFTEVLQAIKDKREAAAAAGETEVALLHYWKGVEKEFKNSKIKLSNDTFQNSVMAQARYRFRERGFIEELDSYEDIIGVGNGLLKLGPKVQFIRGFHNYRISKFTTTDYVPYDATNPYIRDIEAAIDDIYPEPDVRKFIRYHKSLNLDRKPSQNILLLRKGGGSNGKSTDEQLVEGALTDQYFRKIRMQLFTESPEKANSHNSAKMVLKGINGAYADETDVAPRLNTQSLKQLVNPGKIGSRDLNSKEELFENYTNISVLSNHDFIIDTSDHGTWRRLYFYQHKIKFCENPTKDTERKVRGEILRVWPKQREYREAMLSILVHYYEEFMTLYGGQLSAVPVPTIWKETEEFRNKQDTINRFVTEMMVKSPGAPDLAPSVVATRYIEWYNKTIGVLNNSIATVTSQLESSRLDKHVIIRNNGKAIYKMLEGVRIKASIDEPMGADESSFSEVQMFDKHTVETTTDNVVYDEDIKDTDEDLGTFIKRDVKSAIEAEVDELL